MQPVVDQSYPPIDQLYDILIIIALSKIIIQLSNFIQQTMLIQYYQFDAENFLALQQEWMVHFEQSIQLVNAKIDKYSPCHWRIYHK